MFLAVTAKKYDQMPVLLAQVDAWDSRIGLPIWFYELLVKILRNGQILGQNVGFADHVSGWIFFQFLFKK